MPVIDFHVHLGRYEDWHPWVLDFMRTFIPGDPREYLNRIVTPEGMDTYLAENGVDYAIGLAELNPICTGIMSNEDVATLCRQTARVIPFANLNHYMVARPAEELERLVREHGFRGLKVLPPYQLFYPNDPALYPVYAKAQQLGIPVMFHTGTSVFRGSRAKYGDPLSIDDLAVDFPDLTIVMSHSGRALWYQEAFHLALLHPNVYMEIAGLPPQRLLSYFPDFERGADKIVFGSDWPSVRSIAANVAGIRALPISESSKEKILGGNAARILGLA